MTDSDGLTDLTLSRRDAIRGGAALGTLALASRIGAYAQVVEAQITEPRIQLGSDYAIHDNGGNLVINHDPNGDIFVYDPTADQITTLKPLTSVTTGEQTTDQVAGRASNDGTSQTVPTSTVTTVNLFNAETDDSDVLDVQLSNNRIQTQVTGTFNITAAITWLGSADWAENDRVQAGIAVNGTAVQWTKKFHPGVNGTYTVNTSHDGVELSSGDNITAVAYHTAGQGEEIGLGDDWTNIAVTRQG